MAVGRQALACIAALTVASVSAWFAWRYVKALGGPSFEATLLSGAVAILEFFKCLMLPSLTKGAWSRGWRIAALGGAVSFVGLSALNVWGIMSVELLERAALAAKHTTAAQQLADLEAQRGRVENRLRVLGETRPVPTVEADLAAERHNRRWTASKGCTDATRDSRTYCATYNRLFGELAAAQDAANLRARLDELHSQIAQSRVAQTPNAAELQLIAKLFGIDAEMAGFARALVFATVVELFCAFAPTLVWVNLPGSRARRRRRGAGRSWLTWRKETILRSLARWWLRFAAPPPVSSPLDRGGEGEVSPSPATPATGSALEAAKGAIFAPMNDRTPERKESNLRDSYNTLRMSRVAADALLGVVRAPTVGSGPGGVSPVVQGGAAEASKLPAESIGTHNTKLPGSEVHAPAARMIPKESRRTRPRAIAGARTRIRTVSSLLEGGRLEDSRSPASPRPVTTGRCVCSNVADFVRERLERTEGASISAAELRSACHCWCIAHGHEPVSGHRLGAVLRDFGFKKWKTDGRVRYRDLRLRA
jgi:hypothetical protein